MVDTVRIRPFRLDDVDACHAAVAESFVEVGRWQPWCTPAYSRADALAFIAAQVDAYGVGSAYEHAIVDAADRFLGVCGVNQVDRFNRRANLGYWVRSSATGRGVATEATRQVAAWVFAHTDLERLEIVAAVGNLASQRVAEKAGALREGVARRRLWVHGVAHDAVVYSLVR